MPERVIREAATRKPEVSVVESKNRYQKRSQPGLVIHRNTGRTTLEIIDHTRARRK